jgi:amidase
MAEHVLPADTYQVAFDPSVPPALEIDPGDTVTFQTGSDAYERLAAGESVDAIGLPNFNRVTGPVAVRGASPGDALVIEVLDVQVRRAFSVWLPGFGGLGARTDEQRVMETPLRDGRAAIGTNGVSVPIRPMIGCIGTAPAEGSASTFMPAYPHGGNMDLREMEPGTTLYLPVNVPGGLLSMGDLHAAMGTAEPTWVSLEAAGQATLRIDVEPGLQLAFPRLRVAGELYFLGIAELYPDAHALALDQAHDYLMRERGMDAFDAYAYASACCDMRLGGPASTIVMAVLPDD